MIVDRGHDECGRCGSSLAWERCEACLSCGWYEAEFDPFCESCHGTGWWSLCLSASSGWCEAHPLPGRESVTSSTPADWIGGAS